MLFIKNTSNDEHIWGGQIFTAQERRVILSNDRQAFVSDAQFYLDVLNSVSVIADDEAHEILDPVIAFEYVRTDVKTDEEGVTITRMRQVPEAYSHRCRTIAFTTGIAESLNQKIWMNVVSTDASLLFFKLVANVITPCPASEATITCIRWSPAYQTMPKKIQVDVGASETNLASFVGIHGGESQPIGWQYMNNTHKPNSSWVIERVEPRLLPGPINLYIEHAAGQNVKIEVFVEYFTNFVHM